MVKKIPAIDAAELPDNFRKSVQVLHSKPRSPLTLVQRKLGNAWLKHAMSSEPDQDGWFEIPKTKLAESIGFNSRNWIHLNESALALMAIVFEWDVLSKKDSKVEWKASVMFPEVEFSSSAIRFQLSRQMRESVLKPEVYATIDMSIVRKFRKAPSLAIWEFCVRFEKIGITKEVKWEEFRDMILGENKAHPVHAEYKYFKSKVLKPAVTEICSASNHNIELIEIKSGRSVELIRFKVIRKQEWEAGSSSSVLLADLMSIGFSFEQAEKLCKEEPASSLATAYRVTKQRINNTKLDTVSSVPAYFRAALAGKYQPTEPPPSPAASKKTETQPKPPSPADLELALIAKKAGQAQLVFGALSEEEKQKTVQRYNDQQPIPNLRIASRRSKAAETAFMNWYAAHLAQK